jgi:hypothetical protein
MATKTDPTLENIRTRWPDRAEHIERLREVTARIESIYDEHLRAKLEAESERNMRRAEICHRLDAILSAARDDLSELARLDVESWQWQSEHKVPGRLDTVKRERLRFAAVVVSLDDRARPRLAPYFGTLVDRHRGRFPDLARSQWADLDRVLTFQEVHQAVNEAMADEAEDVPNE